MIVIVSMVVVVRKRDVVLMEMERTDQKKHREEPEHHPEHRLVERLGLLDRVREHVKEADAEHQPRHAAHQNLHPGVRQSDSGGKPGAAERSDDDENAVNRDQ
jgi:hypothetical protein